ncbi:hypothetical protein [Nocardioides marmoraquaticus]
MTNPITGEVSRCGRRSTGRRDRLDHGPRLTLFDLPRGWSIAPYSDDFDHGLTRRNLIDGTPIPPVPALAGIVGSLHTCPSCDARSRRRVA